MRLPLNDPSTYTHYAHTKQKVDAPRGIHLLFGVVQRTYSLRGICLILLRWRPSSKVVAKNSSMILRAVLLSM